MSDTYDGDKQEGDKVEIDKTSNNITINLDEYELFNMLNEEDRYEIVTNIIRYGYKIYKNAFIHAFQEQQSMFPNTKDKPNKNNKSKSKSSCKLKSKSKYTNKHIEEQQQDLDQVDLVDINLEVLQDQISEQLSEVKFKDISEISSDEISESIISDETVKYLEEPTLNYSVDIQIDDFNKFIEKKKSKYKSNISNTYISPAIQQEISNSINKLGEDLNDKINKLIKDSTDKINLNVNNMNSSIDKFCGISLNSVNAMNSSIDRLSGISFNSNIKGKTAEKNLEDYLKSEFKYEVLENTSGIPNSGDFILHTNNIKIILESKVYKADVNTEEVNKLKYDLVSKNIKYAVMISFTSGIAKHSSFDIESYDDKHIVFISNPSNKFTNEQLYNEISLAIRVLSIISTKSYNSTIKIDKDKIAECTDKFRNVIDGLTKLKINMNNIKRDIENTINTMSELEIEFRTNLKDITNEIQNCIEINEWKKLTIPDWLEARSTDKKYKVYCMIFDMCNQLQLDVNINNTEERLMLMNKSKLVGYIKLMQRKTVFVKECKYEISLELSIDSGDTFKKLLLMEL